MRGAQLALEGSRGGIAVREVQGPGCSLALTAAVLPTLPAVPGGPAHTLPICPASLPLTKTKESCLQGTGAWHPLAGNAQPSPPWSLPALAPLLLGSQEHVVGVGLEGARLPIFLIPSPRIPRVQGLPQPIRAWDPGRT